MLCGVQMPPPAHPSRADAAARAQSLKGAVARLARVRHPHVLRFHSLVPWPAGDSTAAFVFECAVPVACVYLNENGRRLTVGSLIRCATVLCARAMGCRVLHVCKIPVHVLSK